MTVQDHRDISVEAIRSNLATRREARLHIHGSSMMPWLRQGDVVVARAVQTVQLMVGDILVTSREDGLVTHRLVARDANGWYTKGDNRFPIDPPVTISAILGRVEAVERDDFVQGLHSGRMKNIQRVIGWLSLQEGLAYRRYEGFKGKQSTGVVWAARILTLPFRIPIWVLAAFRR